MLALETLIKEKGPCISIIITTEGAAKKKNYEILKKAVQGAKGILMNKPYPEEVKASFALKLDEAVRIVPRNVLDGLGIFISSTQTSIVPFPFPVQQKIIVDDNFETRDLFYLKQYMTPYYVLSLTTRAMRLYRANMDALEEIKDGNFPLLLEEQYEYEPPSISTSYSSNSLKAYEKDKSIISAIRVKAVLKDADAHLEPYLSKDDARLIIAGTQKITSAFLRLTHFSSKIIGKVPGSFSEKNFAALEKSAWLTHIRRKKNEDELFIQKLIEKDNGHLAGGVREAWKAAHEGKGLLLAVEKDYHCQGYQKPNHDELLLQPPLKPYTIIPDAVDDLMEIVSKRKGKIMIVENDHLTNFGHLALVLRY